MSAPLASLRAGGKAALARALALIEAAPGAEATLELLDAAWGASRAEVIGLTGPPGVGKSTLVSALVRAWRARGRTVGVVAVDPSSKRTKGALLGDRTRIDVDPLDQGVFVRSMAARDRLGGLADLCAAAMVLMRSVFDVVLVETVGVGQSETEIAELVDTVLLAVQPGSGDSLQYMKAGIVEIPDIAVVTKADLGELAARTRRDLEGALRLTLGLDPGWRPPVLMVAAQDGQGIDALVDAASRHAAFLAGEGRREAKRRAQARLWLERWVREEFGRRGAARAAAVLPGITADPSVSPFRWLARTAAALEAT
ncbi:methylmalonyl Co-A mutase-associated GTPase MeaB [Benzoatithermus flavus]|uniref:Methylmalonyl Co-A mutase-associated GTPase MeaB n=1 Tax=Benzoatithermus flavus TaxID=3108223 RepID=A0ABU8XWN0_9PROT